MTPQLTRLLKIDRLMKVAHAGMVRTRGTENFYFYAKIMNCLIGAQIGM